MSADDHLKSVSDYLKSVSDHLDEVELAYFNNEFFLGEKERIRAALNSAYQRGMAHQRLLDAERKRGKA